MKTFFLLLFPILISSQISISPKQNSTDTYTFQYEEINGEKIYKKRCKWCHGPDGNKVKKGVASLAISQLSDEEKKNIVTNGKGTMPPFGPVLSTPEVEAVVTFINGFNAP